MSEPRFCYWSVTTGPYAEMMACCIRSARAVGVCEEFHVWTDRPIPGAICHPCGKFEFKNYLFKFDFLKKMRDLNFEFFVFLDADNYFVRHPGDVIASTQGAPLHVVLESDCTRDSNTRPDWWGCPLKRFVQLMTKAGVRSRSVFNTNAGFWIVHHEVIDRMVDLALNFWNDCHAKGYRFTEEAPLAYVGHMLMGNPYAHVLESDSALWASDWTGCFENRIPDGRPWQFVDYLDGHSFRVDPAIVHCMRSKSAMLSHGRRSSFNQ
ncbi:hypothetical protein FYK55_12705 [Roseiconus nitratireducens]|uniref:Nucleotide-diphospho-sugar transferase domain-containing protein n=1 Tax=Roseiconus nitratireducens TaxID=2605748 RepID=A0A5M6D6G9_9BACT|nr:hypothetical protein [Roseiconus nitratireducens]KAA5543137.1 hypothetical protein FYK55_12705 [Roseiconus nitratireducens]